MEKIIKMKIIGVLLLYVCFVAANTDSPSAIDETKITGNVLNNIQNSKGNNDKYQEFTVQTHKVVKELKHNNINENSKSNQEQHQEHRKPEENHETVNIGQSNQIIQNSGHIQRKIHNKHENIKHYHNSELHLHPDVHQSVKNHHIPKVTQQPQIKQKTASNANDKTKKHFKNITKVHHHSQQQSNNQNTQQHHKQQRHSVRAQQTAQNRHRHSAHRSHMLLKSHSVHRLTNYGIDVDVDGFENEIVEMLKGIELGKINATTTVVLNKYVDTIFNFLRKIISKQNLNTLPLSEETVKVKHAGHCKLSHGTLKDIDTIYRTDNAFISYNTAEKKVTLGFPFKFSDLKIHYDFHVKSRLFKTHGGVNGFIKNARFNPVFSYYYKSDKLTLDHFDMKNTGQLTVKFSGHKLVDWIINPVSKAFTHIFHHKIVNTLQKHVQSSIQKGIGKLNENIAKKIHKK